MRSRLTVFACVCGVLVFLLTAVLAGPARVSAHTGVDFAVPDEGELVVGPIDTITIGFTGPVDLRNEGFEVFDPSGNVISPVVVTADDVVFVLELDPPLSGGTVGVRFEVTGEDGHETTDGFSFTVTAPSSAAPGSTAADATDDTTGVNPPSITTAGQPSELAGATDARVERSIADGAGDDDGGMPLGPVVAVVAALVVAAVGWLLVRPRTSG